MTLKNEIFQCHSNPIQLFIKIPNSLKNPVSHEEFLKKQSQTKTKQKKHNGIIEASKLLNGLFAKETYVQLKLKLMQYCRCFSLCETHGMSPVLFDAQHSSEA